MFGEDTKYFIVNQQGKALSAFWPLAFSGRELKFWKKSAMFFHTQEEAERILAYVIREGNEQTKKAARRLRVSTTAIGWT